MRKIGAATAFLFGMALSSLPVWGESGKREAGRLQPLQTPAESAAAVPGNDSAYLIGPGDVLGIEVWKDPALTRTVVVLPDGRISVPLIGELVGGGKTVAQLKKEIEEKISRYVPEPVLTLEVKQSNSLYIYVLGRVNNSGRSLLTANINVLQALAMAGGVNPFARKNQTKVFRREGGVTKIYPFTYGEVTEGKRLEENIELKRGDVIFVP